MKLGKSLSWRKEIDVDEIVCGKCTTVSLSRIQVEIVGYSFQFAKCIHGSATRLAGIILSRKRRRLCQDESEVVIDVKLRLIVVVVGSAIFQSDKAKDFFSESARS